jgi:DNA mismatch repair ATPase MutS
MKVFLMYPDRDFDPKERLPWNEPALTQDLELNTLFEAMAVGDRFLYTVSKQAVLAGLSDPEAIHYRQEILKDCLRNPSVVREIFSIPMEAIANKKKHWMGIFGRYPSGILSSAIEMLEMFVALLKKLRGIADKHADRFESEGFVRFFAMIKQELGDDYFVIVEDHLRRLRFRQAVLLSAKLGKGNEGANYVLRKPNHHDQNWMKRVIGKRSRVYSFTIHPRDEHGARALEELVGRGINLVANAAAQSADHIDSFFNMLYVELAFYIGCLNLYEQLAQLGEPTSFPVPVGSQGRRHSFTGLYDVCLALTMKRNVVGNDVNADNKDLFVITGANQGGKSVFLRSIGLAQLMMQCGMFVPAESFCANVCGGLFTHYKREEDSAMKSGKFDEELGRMSAIVDKIAPDCMVLFNESFAATNEREGSEIARQIVSALLERRIKVLYVTHLYELAHGLYDKGMTNAIFLRAERQADGTRTFKLTEGEPLQTSYGQDLYNRIFGADNQLRSPNEFAAEPPKQRQAAVYIAAEDALEGALAADLLPGAPCPRRCLSNDLPQHTI